MSSSDTEWTSWQEKWKAGEGPLPDIQARAKREARAGRFAVVAFFVLIALGLAGATVALADPHALPAGVMAVAFCASMSIGYLLIRRGIQGPPDGGPREALGFLERRLRAELRTAHLVRWSYLALFVFFLVIFPPMVRHHSHPEIEIAITFPGMALVAIVTFTAPWWVARRNRRHVDEVTRWKRWLDEQHL
jgi:threonine/homoserine/homoserine lactone efflux protein